MSERTGVRPGQPVRLPALYDTQIVHVRQTPTRHRFRYRSASWLVDVDSLPTVARWLRPIVGFRAADHLFAPRAGEVDSLRVRVESTLRGRDVPVPGGRIVALLNARALGYVFDPLSVFWCFDDAGAVRAVVAEVHNTYGGRHAYVLTDEATGTAVVDKQFYVSPFNPVDGSYRLRMPMPDERLAIDVILDRPDQAPFVATWRGDRREPTTAAIVRSQLRAPLVPLAVSMLIRFQGIRLWAKGLAIVPRDPSDSPDPGAAGTKSAVSAQQNRT